MAKAFSVGTAGITDYKVLAKAYGSAEEMIEQVGETVSFANAEREAATIRGRGESKAKAKSSKPAGDP